MRTTDTTGSRQSRPTAPGFTLIEVLVVVAIIALLIAILLPSLVQARNQAQAAVCMNNIKRTTDGSIMWTMEQDRQQIETNMGWLAGAYRTNAGELGLFKCPTDKSPHPVPVFFVYMYSQGMGSKPTAITSPDAPFNIFRPPGSEIQEDGFPATGYTDKWQLNVQDSIMGTSYGGDGYDDSGGYDLLFQYDAQDQASVVEVELMGIDASWDFKLASHQGMTLLNLTGSVKDQYASGGYTFQAPVAWDSFGINASSIHQARNPATRALLVEAEKTGVFPEELRSYPADNLEEVVALRHGGNSRRTAKGNVGFGDGHVERVGAEKLLDPTDKMWIPPHRAASNP